jgi:peptide/nickel transport system substrate-binding protein
MAGLTRAGGMIAWGLRLVLTARRRTVGWKGIRKSAAVVALAAAWVIGGSADIPAAPAGVLKEAIHWGISADWLDPATTGASVAAHPTMYLFHDSLVKTMPNGLFTPSLAESWTVSPDTKTWEFKLRKGVKFHNGEVMTAEDVVFSYWRYKATNAKFIHGRTEKVEAVNPNQVRIQFKEPFPDFLDYLIIGGSTIGWVVPKKYVEKVGDAGFKRHPIGAGPYKYVEFTPGVRLIGEAFEEYWRKVPNVKRIEFYLIPETATRLAMVKRGEMDIGTLMQGVFYEDLKRSPNLRMLTPQSPTGWLVNMTAQWDPKSPWSDLRVRKAASLAIDRKTLADVHMPGCGPMGTLALEGDPMGVNFPADPYDPEQARKLLAEAGYAKGFYGGKFYPFQSGYWPFGEQIATYWKAVGISVETVLLDKPAFFAMRENKKMKGAVFIDYPISSTIGHRLEFLLGAASYGNYPDVQALWDQYRSETNRDARKDVIARVQRLIHDKAMFLPLTSSNSPAAIGPRVKGNPYKIQPLIWWTAPFEDIELEK